MIKILIPIVFFMVVMIATLAALHWSKYKKRKSGCCGAHEVCEHYPESE